MSQRGLARAMQLDAAAVSLMLRGRRAMKVSEAAEIARLLGVPADEVMTHAGVRTAGTMQVAVIGSVDGAGEVTFASSGTVPHLGGALPAAVSAVQCQTSRSVIDHMDGWVLFVPDARSGIPAESVGRLSLCRIRGGLVYLAAPTRSYTRGRWDLSGPAGTAKAVDLEWAVPVLLIAP
jgi:hypothetical protein